MKARRYFCILLALAMMLALVPSVLAANRFEDVRESDFFYDAVQWAVSRGVTDGTSPTTFSPEEICTRAQVVTFLWRAKGEPEPKEMRSSFTDVEAGGYYEKAVFWALEEGVTTGTDDTSFSPDDPCTYAHIITFLWRANGSPEAGGSSWLTADWPESWYKDAVTWAERGGMFEGEDEQFDPDAPCSRARTVVWLQRDAVIYAGDVMRLMEAVSSGREIYLSPGTYDLSEWVEYIMEGQPWDTGNPAVTLTQVYDGWEVRIQNVRNLTIAAQPGAEGPVVLTAEPPYAKALSFYNCDEVSLVGMTLGSDFVSTDDSSTVRLIGCTLGDVFR